MATETDRQRYEREWAVWWLRDIPQAMRDEAKQAPTDQEAKTLERWALRIEMICVSPPTQADIDWARQVVEELGSGTLAPPRLPDGTDWEDVTDGD